MDMLRIGNQEFGAEGQLGWILGPCVMESRELLLETAAYIHALMQGRPWIFKSSFDKANRMSVDGFRGPGLALGLEWLAEVKERFGVPVLTDIHLPDQAAPAAQVADVLQIPAFLCRQTDLILAAAQTGAVINLKQGQFVAPWDMREAVNKVRSTGNNRFFTTHRGTSFGYNNLVMDVRAIPILKEFGGLVCLDVTHACQLPGAGGTFSGGLRQYVPHLARAGAAAGAQLLFLETHPQPERAKSDAAIQWPLAQLGALIESCEAVARCVPVGV